jgi:hypothetical protein
VAEIHGLLYYAVHENDEALALAHDAPDPTRPLDLSVYADGEPAPKPDWPARVKLLDEETPLIVFSKVTHIVLSVDSRALIAFFSLFWTDVLLVGGVLGCF